MLLKGVISSSCEKNNSSFSTQWFLEVAVSELQKSQYNIENADLRSCNWKCEKNMLTAHAVLFEGLRMRQIKQFIDDCLKTTPSDKSLLKCYLIKFRKSRSFWGMLKCIWGLTKNIIKRKSVRQINLVGQVKSLLFLSFKSVSSSNWALKWTLVIIGIWALK